MVGRVRKVRISDSGRLECVGLSHWMEKRRKRRKRREMRSYDLL